MTIYFELYELFISMYHKDKSNLAYLIDSDVPKIILIEIYEALVKDNLITRIEQLPEEKKKELVSECRGTGLFFTNESLIRSAKILHTLKFIK